MTQEKDKSNEGKNSKPKERKKSAQEIDSLSKLEELQKQLAAERDKNLRLQAEYENYRKRMFKEQGDSQWYGKMAVLEPVLKVFDTFSLALKSIETLDEKDPLKIGLQMIYKEFDKMLLDLNVETIDGADQNFDHNLHYAFSYEESDRVPQGKIIKQWSYGYKIGNNIIRPASVVVSSGPNKTQNNKTKSKKREQTESQK